VRASTVCLFNSAAEIIEELSPRSKDVIVSTGEKLSARIFTAVLQDAGLESRFINLEKLINRKPSEIPGSGKSMGQPFYDYLVHQFQTEIFPTPLAGTRVIPVVTGFFGPVPGSLLKSIGRGYTDLTAALIAVALGADELQIFKEVDGIFSADPRKVPTAKVLDSISPEEAAELTYYGSEVIHPFTMEQVIRAKIPIRIKNTFNPSAPGTLILPNAQPIPSLESLPPTPLAFQTMHATAVTIKDNMTVVNIHSNRKSVSHGFFSHIFKTLDEFGMVVDLISTSEVHISMALSSPPSSAATKQLGAYGDVRVLPNMAIIS